MKPLISAPAPFAQQELEAALSLAESIARVSGPAILALVLYGLLKGWLVTKIHHDDVVKAMKDHYEAIVDAKDREIAELHTDRDWWKDSTMTTLKIGEHLAEGGEG